MSPPLIVAKVGGSLYDMPDLAGRLRGWITTRHPSRVLLIPGGGLLADAVRHLDEVHGLGDEASHWLAVRVLSLAAHFLGRLLPEARVLRRIPHASDGQGPFILDPFPFFLEDEHRAERLPHQWSVTSDSLAVRVAVCAWAAELVLLKSVSYDSTDWLAASEDRIVDGYFGMALNKASESPAGRFPVHVINLREWQNERPSE